EWPKRDDDDWNPQKILLNSRYRSPDPSFVSQYNKKDERIHFNENVGGMSVFYGGAAFRLRPNDFIQWPLSYADFAPHYEMAEMLMNVHGRNKNESYSDELIQNPETK